MNTSDGTLSFATAIDTSGFSRGAALLQNIIDNTGTQLSGQLGNAIDLTGALEGSFKRLASAVGIGFSVKQAWDFVGAVREVRAEIQSLEISFETLLGSKPKADALFKSIREFAVNTPMQLKDLASSAQMMLSFNIDEDKIMPYLKALGDVSMGDAQKFQSLSLAFSQMSSAGKLMGQDLMQMINAGFNPLSVMAEKTGKSISELKDEMSAGKISAEMVQQAFIDATSEGGKFYNMLEKQSKGIAGAMSNLQGAIDDMFNELGESSEGIITGTYTAATAIVKNWKDVAEAVGAAVAAYGLYKAAVMTETAITRTANTVQYEAEAAELSKVIAMKEADANADVRSAVASGKLTAAKGQAIIAARAEAEAVVQSLQAKAAMTKADLDGAIVAAQGAKAKKVAALQNVESANAELKSAIASKDASAIATAQAKLDTAQKELNTAATTHNAASKDVAAKKKIAATAATTAETAATQLNTAAEAGNAAATGFLAAAKAKLMSAIQKLYATMTAHPYAMIAAAVIALVYAIYKLCTAQSDAEKASKRLNETITKGEASINAEQQAIKSEFDALKNLEKGTKQYEAAKTSIINKYGEYLKGLINEKNELINVEQAYIRVANAARDAARARALEAAQDTAKDTYNEQTTDKFNKIYEIIQKRAGNQANALWDIVRSEIEGGNGLSGQTRKLMQQAFGIKNKQGRKYGEYDSDVQSIMDSVSQITTAQKTLADSMRQTQAIYGDAANKFVGYTNEELKLIKQQILDLEKSNDLTDAKIYLHGKEIASINGVAEAQRALNDIADARKQNGAADKMETTLAEEYAAAQTAWQSALKKVADMDADRAKYTAKEYETATAELKSAKERFEKLGGDTSKKTSGKTAEQLYAEADTSSEKLTTVERKQARDRKRSVEDMEMDIWQARINAGEYGTQAYIQQRELDFKKEQIQLQRQMEDAIDAEVARQKEIWDKQQELAEKEAKANGKTYTRKAFDSDNLSGMEFKPGTVFEDKQIGDVDMANIYAISQQYAQLERLILAEQEKTRQDETKRQQQALNEYLAQWGEYLQKRQALIDIANAKLNDPDSNLTEGERKSIAAQLTKDLADLDTEATKTTNAIGKLFGDMTGKTVKDLRNLASEGQKALDMLTNGEEFDEKLGDTLGITKEMWEALKNDKDELEKIRKAIKDIKGEADKLESPTAKITKGFKDVFAAGNDKEKLKKALEELKEGLGEVFSAASVLSSALSSLGDAFGSGALSGIADGLNTAMDAVNSAMQGAQAGAQMGLGVYGAAAGAAIGLVGSLGSSLAKLHDAKHEKKIQKIQEQIDALEKSYSSLGDQVEKAYSKDASNLISQQNKLLEQQKVLVQQQINEEKSKKKSDDDRISQWQDQLDEINKAIADNKEKAVDAIFGEDLKSAIDNFADAYADAWAQGESRAKTAKDTVRSMMKQMVEESIKAAIQSSGAMEEIRQRLQEFYADNVLSQWEQDYVYNMAEQLQRELDEQFSWAESLLNGGKYQQSGSTGAFQSMSEDTGQELNGRFTAMQVSMEQTRSISEGIKTDTSAIAEGVISLRTGMEEIQNIALLQLGELESINRNTRQLADMSQTLDRIDRNIQKL